MNTMPDNNIKRIHKLLTGGARVCTDTRKISQGCIFFALKGENFNGNKFINDALEKGAIACIADEDSKDQLSDKVIEVPDVLTFLQDLALFHRREFNIPVLAITGSNGKTTTKELIAAVVAKKYNTLFTKGNLNNHIGVPLTLLELTSAHELAVIEMGANHCGEIELLCQIAEPNHVLITNVGMAHIEGFGGIEGVKKGKGEMYDHARENNAYVFLNSADNDLRSMLGEYPKTISYGGPDDIVNGSAEETGTGLALKIKIEDHSFEIISRLTGTYNLSNILAAVCIGHHFKVAEQDLCDAITAYIPSNSRSQVIKKGNITIMADMYNANPTSMEAALLNFGKNFAAPKAIFLGAMHELGNVSGKYHKQIAKVAREQGPEILVFIGAAFKTCCTPEDLYFHDTENLQPWLRSQDWNGYSILVKGSRAEKMENLVHTLVSS